MIPALHWYTRLGLGLLAVPVFLAGSALARALSWRLAQFPFQPSPLWTFLADVLLLAVFVGPLYIWFLDPIILRRRRPT